MSGTPGHPDPREGAGSRMSAPAERVARIVELLVANPGRRLTLSQIVDELDLSISTVHSILTTLAARHWITRHSIDKSYTIGPRLAAAGRAAKERIPGMHDVEHAVDRLTKRLDLVCAASALDGDDIVIVAQARPWGIDDPATRIGQRVPFGAPFGAGFVAWRSDDEIEAWLDRSPLGISPTERALYREVLEGIRARGFGVERFDTARTRLHDALVEFRDETMSSHLIERIRDFLPLITVRELLPEELSGSGDLDIAMVHSPVFDESGRAAFNITVHLRRHGVDRAELDKIAKLLVETAESCTAILQAG
jgi:DNA-binding IclR family transcriptional regulator